MKVLVLNFKCPDNCLFFMALRFWWISLREIFQKCSQHITSNFKHEKSRVCTGHFSDFCKFVLLLQKNGLNPLTPELAVSSCDEPRPSFHFWHHPFRPKLASSLCSTCAGGKHLSNDAQIRVTGRMKREVCSKMLKKLSETLGAKFPATTPGCSIAKIAHLDAFWKVF